MANEIIYICNSVNNKNVREGELEILEKHEDELYFEFGLNATNTKKRFYNDIETLNKDFDALMKLKNKTEIDEETKEKAHKLVEEAKEKDLVKTLDEIVIEEEPKEKFIKPIKKTKRKNSLF